MNNDLYMNDTLDNFVFSQTEDFCVKTTTNIEKDSKRSSRNEISFDDSEFISLSFSGDSVRNVNEEKKCRNLLGENNTVLNSATERHTISNSINSFPIQTSKLNFCNPDEKENIGYTIENLSNCNKSLKNSSVTNVNSKRDDNTEVLIKNIRENDSHKKNCMENFPKNNPELCKLSSWGLPEAVLEKYHSRNIINMFPWQVECLSNIEVLGNYKNLIYSAPTSAGKTLVAEILALKTIFERQKKVIFILPFVSIVREKMYYFQDVLGSSGIRVEGFMGSYNPPGGFASVDFAVCTIEKANSLVNRLLEDSKLSDIGAMLVDEMHLLGDPSRGYLLELLLTKLRYVSKKEDNVNIQIIGMSATLPNLSHLAKWLQAELYTTDFRPIPLHEQAHVCGEVYDNNLKLIRKLSPLPDVDIDTDNILQLCLETIKDSCSVLIFCPTKNWCENLSQQIATAFFKIGNTDSEWGRLLRSQLKVESIIELLEQLKYCPVGLDAVLRRTVSFGVAFHHAGLTMDERDIIEGAFRNGTLRVLVATSTLSSGVNLPARRVIIRTPHFHGKPIDALTYRQMIGRAGRMGKDALGESFLICQKNDYKIAKELMSAELSSVESCLEGAGKLKRAILEVIASGVASSPDDVMLFTKCTLLAVDNESSGDVCNLNNPIDEAVNFLKNNEFIRLQKQDNESEKYIATSLGKACLSSSIAPDEGLALFTELEKARRCFVLETELHLIYLVTPYSACNSWGNIDWMLYLELWERLPSTMKKVGDLVGVQDSYIVNATRGKLQTNTNKLYHKLLVHKRFFVALALQDLVNEKPLGEVCAKFSCNRGMLQSLQQSASSFAGMVTAFCRQLGWSSVEILLSQFQDRMQFGVGRELLDLMRLPILNGQIARTLYNAGIEMVTQLANSDIVTVENVLYKSMPFESKKERDGETNHEKYQRNKFRIVWIAGKDGLTEREAAEIMVADARRYLKLEMGLAEAKWENEVSRGDLDIAGSTGREFKTSSSTKVEQHITLENVNKNPESCKISTSKECNLQSEQKDTKTDKSDNINTSVDTENSTLFSEESFMKSDIEDQVCTDSSRLPNYYKKDLEIGNDMMANISLLTEEIFNKIEVDEANTDTNNLSDQQINSNSIKSPKMDSDPLIGTTNTRNSNGNVSSSKHCSIFSDNNNIVKEAIPQSVLSKTNAEGLQTNSFSTSSSFSDINFTAIEENLVMNSDEYVHCKQSKNVSETFKIPSTSFTKHEVSQILLSPTQAELNISDSSVFSSHSNANTTTDKIESDVSLFDDSFNLRLNESDKESSKDSGVKELNHKGDNLDEIIINTSSESFQMDKSQQSGLNISDDDFLSSSLNENSPKTCKKRKNNTERELGTPSKKKKANKAKSRVSETKHSETFSLPIATFTRNRLEFNSVDIVDACQHESVLKSFEDEFKHRKTFSISLGYSKVEEKKPIIGMNIIQPGCNSIEPETKTFCYKNRQLDGFSVTWDGAKVFYCSLTHPEFSKRLIELLKSTLANGNIHVRIFDSKEQIKLLYSCCGIIFAGLVDDPKVADWLLQPEGREKNLLRMAIKYCPKVVKVAQLVKNYRGVGSIGLDFSISADSKIRASVEALLTWHLMDSLKLKLQAISDNYEKIYDAEMKITLCLVNMEINGMNIRKDLLQKTVNRLKKHMAEVEKEAYSLAGRRFNFASSKEVAKVIGMFRGKKVSTRKQVLEQNQHPVSPLVIQWRKVHSILVKMIYPLLRAIQKERIHGRYITNTATGRITMHEPNVQNVAKDFNLVCPLTKEIIPVSCRSTFQVPDNCIMVSADYCQIELRILAHLSQDKSLCTIMRRPGDVFRSIAAKWNRMEEKEVTESIRQNAKQLCYGIIYGMKSKSLAQQLAVEEEEATIFMNTFINTYPGLKKFIKETVDSCKSKGYVETIFGRRRYLPQISEMNNAKRGQAERQAVNTTVQGSAADIAKRAMILIENELDKAFSGEVAKPKLVLHLHDELIYEVPARYEKKVAEIIRKNMENAIQLSVPLPVKLKTGKSWGEMSEYRL